MKVNEMIEFLKEQPQDAECYFSVWTGDRGEVMFRTQISNPDRMLSKNGKFVRITWVDDCMAHHVQEEELSD